MSVSRPIQWYHSHADSKIWPDSTFKDKIKTTISLRKLRLTDLQLSPEFTLITADTVHHPSDVLKVLPKFCFHLLGEKSIKQMLLYFVR